MTPEQIEHIRKKAEEGASLTFSAVNALCDMALSALQPTAPAGWIVGPVAGGKVLTTVKPTGGAATALYTEPQRQTGVWMPKEPSGETIEAMALAYEQSPCHDLIGPMEDAYRAMIEAAPQPPQGE